MLIFQVVLLAAGILLLWFGADLIVTRAASIARRLGISELVIGLTVVAMGTSAPEFLVTMVAAFQNKPSISLANVIGSNIFNLGLILGSIALIRPVTAHKTVFRRDGLVLLVATVLLLVMSLDGKLSHLEGLVLLAYLGIYLTFLIARGSRQDLPSLELPQEKSSYGLSVDLLWLFSGLVAVSLGSKFLVDSASALALAFGISQWFIGLTVVASGTSLPELVTCLAASVRGKNDMLLGNLIGSDLFNFSGVLGLTCLLRPLTVAPESLLNLSMAVAGVLLVMFVVRTGWRVSRTEGALLVIFGLARWFIEYL